MNKINEMIERAAKTIYEYDMFGLDQGIPLKDKPAWNDGGNSTMQNVARVYALAALNIFKGDRPFTEGDLVTLKNQPKLGVLHVTDCRWVNSKITGVNSYWCCDCVDQDEDGYISSSWSGPASYLVAK